MRYRINSNGHAEIVYPDESIKEIAFPSRKVPINLCRSIPGDRHAVMYHFLVKLLKIPDSSITNRMVVALVRAGITPDILCLADLTQLTFNVRNFGPRSVEIIEKAIRSYKKK